MSADLVAFLRARLDADELLAIEASRRYGEQAPEGGVHWQWEDPETDTVVTPDPGQHEFVGGEETFRVALRSRETWPTHSVGELPQFAIPTAEEVPSAVGGHIARHDPARVLAEVDAKRRIIDEVVPRMNEMTDQIHGEWGTGPMDPSTYESLDLLCLLALPYSDRPGYREEWRP